MTCLCIPFATSRLLCVLIFGFLLGFRFFSPRYRERCFDAPRPCKHFLFCCIFFVDPPLSCKWLLDGRCELRSGSSVCVRGDSPVQPKQFIISVNCNASCEIRVWVILHDIVFAPPQRGMGICVICGRTRDASIKGLYVCAKVALARNNRDALRPACIRRAFSAGKKSRLSGTFDSDCDFFNVENGRHAFEYSIDKTAERTRGNYEISDLYFLR